MNFRDFLKSNIVYLDGGMGTLLQSCGLQSGEYPERLNISRPELIANIHKMYFEAGANVAVANTFGASTLKFSDDELEAVVSAALNNARRAREYADAPQEKFIALDIGPTGKLLAPLGELGFEDAVAVFAKTVRLGVKYGAELILIETMNDSYETKAALLAAKENSELPIIVTNAYGTDGKLMTGAEPEAMVAMLEGMGADAIGANCSLGPRELMPVLERLLAVASVPVVVKPNAGLPRVKDGKTVFDIDAREFACELARMAELGARVLGGCCGTTPEYISALTEATSTLPQPTGLPSPKGISMISSYTHAVRFGGSPILIGERINPTGKKPFREAIKAHDMDYILNIAIAEEEAGAAVLDVNVGLPEIDERAMLAETVEGLQSVTALPLQIDTSDPAAMEAALRIYNGKAMINSVNGKEESMRAVFPLVKKYGGLVVALTLDESGIPPTAEGRLAIARRILARAEEYGIARHDIIFDPLTLTVSADPGAAKVTLDSVRLIGSELSALTSLGVSNVSFGLPERDIINSAFFAMALEAGLNAAIMNPHSRDMMRTYYAYRALSGYDEGFDDYMKKAGELAVSAAPVSNISNEKTDEKFESELRYAIVKGLREKAMRECELLLEGTAPLDIVSSHIMPALDYIGAGFENKTVFLPQLLISAEVAKAVFERIKLSCKGGSEVEKTGERFVIATVKGDIHDIGKNIVKLIMENYGYDVIDLGRDVAPEAVLEAVRSSGARLVGLSALMTTTVPAMEATIKLLKLHAPGVRVIVGGAVLTADYAERIGADAYAADAMETVRAAEKLLCT